MAKFKPGQEVTPTIRKFTVVFGNPDMPTPKFGKVYTVRDYPYDAYPDYMALMELPMDCVYNEASFAPVISDYKLEDDLEELFMLKERLADG